MNKTRSWDIDLIKALAITGVVLIHVSAGGFSGSVGSGGWLSALFWGTVSRASVPLFFLCSGALLLDPGHDLPMKKLWGRNILRLLAALLFWAMAYKVYFLWQGGALTAANLIQAAKDVLFFHHQNHLYYLHIALLVYACLPVTRLLVRHGDRRLLEYALGLWFLLGILYPTVKGFWPFTLLTGIPVQWRLNMTWAAIGYGLLGWYLRRYPLSQKAAGLLAAGGLAFIFGGTWWMSLRQGTLYQTFLEGMSVGVCLLAMGIYGLCVRLPAPSDRVRQGLAWCSGASFCVFLVHIFFLDQFRRQGWMLTELPLLLSIPLVSAALLVCGGAVYAVLSRVPVVKRWLI